MQYSNFTQWSVVRMRQLKYASTSRFSLSLHSIRELGLEVEVGLVLGLKPQHCGFAIALVVIRHRFCVLLSRLDLTLSQKVTTFAPALSDVTASLCVCRPACSQRFLILPPPFSTWKSGRRTYSPLAIDHHHRTDHRSSIIDHRSPLDATHSTQGTTGRYL